MKRTIVTEENIDDVKSDMNANDQRDELGEGCVTWRIPGGQMTVWPNGRGAVAWGGNSVYGDWDLKQELLILDDADVAGNIIAVDDGGISHTIDD